MLLRIAVFAMLTLAIVGGGEIAWVTLASAPAKNSTPAAPIANAIMLVAAHSIRAGLLIKPEDLATHETPITLVPPGASLDVPQSRSNLTGAMVRHSLSEGQPILPADIARPGDHGFLAAVLGPNMRAITVAVDAVSGTAGLIWPGDRVDLILTQAMEDPSLIAGHRVAAETVLSDARVIAVDQQIVQGQAPDGSVAPANRTATLEVTASQAERVLVAERLGKLSLSVLSAETHSGSNTNAAVSLSPDLRTTARIPTSSSLSPASRKATTVPPSSSAVTWASDVSPALSGGETHAAPVTVRVFQGDADGKEFHY